MALNSFTDWNAIVPVISFSSHRYNDKGHRICNMHTTQTIVDSLFSDPVTKAFNKLDLALIPPCYLALNCSFTEFSKLVYFTLCYLKRQICNDFKSNFTSYVSINDLFSCISRLNFRPLIIAFI